MKIRLLKEHTKDIYLLQISKILSYLYLKSSTAPFYTILYKLLLTKVLLFYTILKFLYENVTFG